MATATAKWLLRVILAAVRIKLGKNDNLIKRFELLKLLANRLLPEYRFKWPQIDWWQSDRFSAYLDRFEELSENNSDRRWTVAQFLRLVAKVSGDTAEVGCYFGAMSWLICEANLHADTQRFHHIFDSFAGLSLPSEYDGMHWNEGDLACSEQLVHAFLSPFVGKFKTYSGWVPSRFKDVLDRSFAFVHVDVDLYEPTLDSLAFFYPRLSAGGILICDDYGFSTCPGATLACDQYLVDKPESMIKLADGGGFIIKGIPTSDDLYKP